MNVDIDKLETCIDRCIRTACRVEKRDNDVQYTYRIIKSNLLFAISSKHQRVRIHIERNLLKKIPQQFGLTFNLVLPDPIHEYGDCWKTATFDVIRGTVDPNFSVDQWKIFGKTYIIRYKKGLKTASTGEQNAMKHLTLLREHGFDYLNVDNSWDTFINAYKEAYGCLPIDSVES